MPTSPILADQQWLLHTWVPQTIAETGYWHCTVLPAPDPAHRLHTPPVVAELQQHLLITLFEALDHADSWLHTELAQLLKH